MRSLFHFSSPNSLKYIAIVAIFGLLQGCENGKDGRDGVDGTDAVDPGTISVTVTADSGEENIGLAMASTDVTKNVETATADHPRFCRDDEVWCTGNGAANITFDKQAEMLSKSHGVSKEIIMQKSGWEPYADQFLEPMNDDGTENTYAFAIR